MGGVAPSKLPATQVLNPNQEKQEAYPMPHTPCTVQGRFSPFWMSQCPTLKRCPPNVQLTTHGSLGDCLHHPSEQWYRFKLRNRPMFIYFCRPKLSKQKRRETMIGSTLLLSASQSTRQLWDLGCHIGMSSTGSHVRGRVRLLITYMNAGRRDGTSGGVEWRLPNAPARWLPVFPVQMLSVCSKRYILWAEHASSPRNSAHTQESDELHCSALLSRTIERSLTFFPHSYHVSRSPRIGKQFPCTVLGGGEGWVHVEAVDCWSSTVDN